MNIEDEPKRPSYAKCRPCGHVWIYAYLPALVDVFVRQMRRATCPMCGATSKQIDVLARPLTPEEAAATTITITPKKETDPP